MRQAELGASRPTIRWKELARASKRALTGLLALGGTLAASVGPASAQDRSYAQMVREANDMTITIVAGAPGETSLDIAQDLAVVLHCVDGLRVVPIVGRGDANNVYDLLFLRGVDMAIVRADVLDYVAETNAYVSDLKDRVLYVAPLFEQEVHLIASEDIQSIADLQGRLVNIGATGTIALESKRILEAAGVTVIESKFDNRLALERVVDGTLDAMFITGGKPLQLLDQLNDVTGLHLVSIPPLSDSVYTVTELTHEDYPSLVPADGPPVQTIAVPSVLAVYNWPDDSSRYAKNAVFTAALYRRAPYLRRPARHAKWATSDMLSDIPGWERFAPAVEIVSTLRVDTPEPTETAAIAPVGPRYSNEELEQMFEERLQLYDLVPRSDEERAQLFEAFKRNMLAQQTQ